MNSNLVYDYYFKSVFLVKQLFAQIFSNTHASNATVNSRSVNKPLSLSSQVIRNKLDYIIIAV